MDQPDVAVTDNTERRTTEARPRNLSVDFWFNARSRLIVFWMIASWVPVICSSPRIFEGSWLAYEKLTITFNQVEIGRAHV